MAPLLSLGVASAAAGQPTLNLQKVNGTIVAKGSHFPSKAKVQVVASLDTMSGSATVPTNTLGKFTVVISVKGGAANAIDRVKVRASTGRVARTASRSTIGASKAPAIPTTRAARATLVTAPKDMGASDPRTVLFNLSNDERRKAGLRTLVRNDCLMTEAQAWTVHMQQVNKLFHSSMATLLRTCVKRSVGENVAVGGSTPEETIRMWMNSPGHSRSHLPSRHSRGVRRQGADAPHTRNTDQLPPLARASRSPSRLPTHRQGIEKQPRPPPQKCPAAGPWPSAKCARKPDSETAPPTKRRIHVTAMEPADMLPIGKQQRVTFAPEDGAKFVQPLVYGSDERLSMYHAPWQQQRRG